MDLMSGVKKFRRFGFEDRREKWASYTERLEQYFTANDIKIAEKKRAILLSVCGAATYQVIRNLTTPGKPTDHTFEELVQLVQAHRNPPSISDHPEIYL